LTSVLERDPDPCTRADFIMAEVSHGTGDETLGDGGLEELCVLLKASDIVVEGLNFLCEKGTRPNRPTVSVRFGVHKKLYIPCGPEVEYTDLMQAIGECTNVNRIFIVQKFFCDDLLFVQLCKALCQNHSVSYLSIALFVDGSQDCQPNVDIFLNQVVVMLESNVGLKRFHFFFFLSPSSHLLVFRRLCECTRKEPHLGAFGDEFESSS
jgi:hypothetical protein